MEYELTKFFDSYRDSFPKGPAAIASFYAEPCMTARMGVVRVNASQVETTAVMTAVDEQYRARGFASATYVTLDMRALGANAALATLQWTYRDIGGEALWATTFTYNLYRRGGAWKILVQTMHDE